MPGPASQVDGAAARAKVSLKVVPKKKEPLLFNVGPPPRPPRRGGGGPPAAAAPVVAHLKLRNKGAHAPLAFKVKTNSADRYWVEPKCGFLAPGAAASIRVELRPELVEALHGGRAVPADTASNRFLVQTVSVLPGEMSAAEPFLSVQVASPSEDGTAGAGDQDATVAAVVNRIFAEAGNTCVLNSKRNVQVVVQGAAAPAPAATEARPSKAASEESAAAPAAEAAAAEAAAAEAAAEAAADPLAPPPPPQLDMASAASDRETPQADAGVASLVAAALAAPSAETTAATAAAAAAASDEQLQRLEKQVAALQQQVAEKDKAIASLKAKHEQASQQLAQSVEAHRDARRTVSALRKLHLKPAPEPGSKKGGGRDDSAGAQAADALREKRDATSGGAWDGSDYRHRDPARADGAKHIVMWFGVVWLGVSVLRIGVSGLSTLFF